MVQKRVLFLMTSTMQPFVYFIPYHEWILTIFKTIGINWGVDTNHQIYVQ